MGIVENSGFGIMNAFIYLNVIYNLGSFIKILFFYFDWEREWRWITELSILLHKKNSLIIKHTNKYNNLVIILNISNNADKNIPINQFLLNNLLFIHNIILIQDLFISSYI